MDVFNKRVNGHYDACGHFIVKENERYERGRCDEKGYLLDK